MKAILSLLLLLMPFAGFSQRPILAFPLASDTLNASVFPAVPYSTVASYSLNREGISKLNDAFNLLRRQMVQDSLIGDSARSASYQNQLDSLQSLINFGEPSVIHMGEMATSAQKFRNLSKRHIEALNEILIDSVGAVPSNRCMPIYRDGLVFFDEAGEVVAYIDICFSCWAFRLNGETYVPITTHQWFLLHEFFRRKLGHPVGPSPPEVVPAQPIPINKK